MCIRLFSEEDFNNRTEFTDPEIVRSNLAAVIPRMAALKLGDVAAFRFLEMPDSRYINDGFQVLLELGAVNEHNHLTKLANKWRAAHRPENRAHFAGGEEARLHGGNIGDCVRAVDSRPARAAVEARDAAAGARAFYRQAVRFPCLSEHLGQLQRERDKGLSKSSGSGAANISCRTCGCASGASCTTSCPNRD